VGNFRRNVDLLETKNHQQQRKQRKKSESDVTGRSPARTSKLFRPYLDADSPTSSSRAEDHELPALTTTMGEVERAAAAAAAAADGHEKRSTDGGSPRVTSLSHATARKYGCDLCGRLFSRSNTLVTHRVTSNFILRLFCPVLIRLSLRLPHGGEGRGMATALYS